MTTILGLLLSVSLLSAPRINTSLSNPQIERVATTESTFAVQNNTPISVGTVVIGETDQNSAVIDVTGGGRFEASLTATAVTCTINGQTCLQGQPTWIRVDTHTAVRATWTSDIVVIDQSEKL